jgi:purine catabolism regulator
VTRKGDTLSLGELLAERAFGLELLTGGEGAHARPILGAHPVEVEDPTRWLSRHWVMLTTGVRLRGHAETQRELVRELDEAAVSALGFGVGLAFKRVPPALLEAAEARGFPVFAVPYETAFRDIVRFIDSSLIAGDEKVYRRLSALQRYLVDALRDAQPERAVVERLAGFLEASVVIYSGDGELETASGEAPVAELWRGIAAAPPGLVQLEVGDWHAVATPVASRADRPARWLVLTSRRAGFVTKLIKPAAEAAAPLLSALARVDDVVRDQEEAVRGALLDEACRPLSAEEAQPLTARAASFGLDLSAPARAVVIARHPRRDAGGAVVDLDAVRRTLVAHLEHGRAPHLVGRREDTLIALVQDSGADLRAALDALTAAHPDVAVGVGSAIDAIAHAHRSLRDAQLAVNRVGMESEQQVLDVEDLDLGTFVLSQIAPERLEPKLEEIRSVLRANPSLHETLLAFFDHDLDIVATARALHLHPNSLRYRLSRLERLLGRSLRQPATIAALYLVIVAESTPRS